MINMFKSVYSRVDAVADRVYDTISPQTATYPYAVITYPTVSENDESTRQEYILEIDVYDNLTDTTRLEELVIDIDNALNRVVDSANFYKIYRNSPYLLRLPDEDENLRRIQLRYIVHKF